jgi:hypothetical protein
MAQKEYSISQSVNLNGQIQSRTFNYYGELDDVTAIVELLEGLVKVKEVISTTGTNTTPVTTANFAKSISMYPASDVYVPAAYIRSFDKRALILKNTKNIDEIKAVLALVTPFRGNAVAKPASISCDFSEKIV